MNKLVAIINVISWAGFWSFGYLALTADHTDQGQIVTAAILAGAGLVTGSLAYAKLSKGQRLPQHPSIRAEV